MKRSLLGVLLCIAYCLLLACSDNKTATSHLGNARSLMAEGQLPAASLELKNAIQKDQNNADARLLLGEVYFETGNFPGATKELRRAIKLGASAGNITPLLAQVLLADRNVDELAVLSVENISDEGRAIILAAQGLGDLARSNRRLAEFKIGEALNIDPESQFARLARVRLSLLTGNTELAQTQLEKLLEESRDYAPAWSLKGDLEQIRRNLDVAENAYTRAIELLAFNIDERLKRAVVRIELKQYDDAGEDIEFLSKAFLKSPGVNYAKGLLAFETGDLKSAFSALEQVVAVSNSYPMAFYYLGSAHYRLGNLAQAEHYAKQFFSIAPNYTPGRKLLSVIMLDTGRYTEAEEILRPIIDFSDYDTGALNLMAMVVERQGKVDESVELLSKIAELQPSSAVVQIRLGAGRLLAGDSEGNAKNLETARKLDPDLQQIAQPLILAHLQAGQYDLALKTAEEFRDSNPDSIEPYNLLARAYMTNNQIEGAKKAYSEALLISPGNPQAGHGLAFIALRGKNLGAAHAYYSQVLEHHPNHLFTLVKLAMLEGAEGDHKSMLKYLQQAIESHPQAVDPRLILARHYLRVDKPDQVPTLFTDLGATAQNNPAVLDVAASAQLARKQYSDAIITLERLLRQQPDMAQTHYRLASAYAGANDKNNMRTHLARALELEPEHYPARLAQGRLSLAGDEAGTQEHLNALQRQNGKDPDVLELAASLANQQGEYDRALKLLQESFNSAPSTTRMLMLARQMNGMGNSDEAQNLQKTWVGEHPDDVIAMRALSEFYRSRNEIDKVIGLYEQILVIDPDNFVALNNLASYMREDEPARALEYATRARRVRPRSAEALITLAVIQLKMGELDGAGRSIETARAMQPHNRRLIYYQARIDASADRIDNALIALDKLLAEETEFPELNEARDLLSQLQQ